MTHLWRRPVAGTLCGRFRKQCLFAMALLVLPLLGKGTIAGEQPRVILTSNGNTFPSAINGAGQVIGRTLTANGFHAFIWQNGNFTDLNETNGLGNVEGDAQAINAVGDVAGSAGPFTSPHAAVWRQGQITDLNTLPGGSFSRAVDINDNGQVVGIADTSSGAVHVFVWQSDSLGMIELPTLGGSAGPSRINRVGQVVGASQTSTGQVHAVLWNVNDFGKYDLIDIHPDSLGSNSTAVGIDDEGHVAGNAFTPPSGPPPGPIPAPASTNHGFFWDGAKPIDLGLNTSVDAMNRKGMVLGHFTSGQYFVWQNGTKIDLPTIPNGTSYNATTLNDAGEVIGTYVLNGAKRVFISQGSAIRDLGDLGGSPTSASAINNFGQIVGNGDPGPFLAGVFLQCRGDPTTDPSHWHDEKYAFHEDEQGTMCALGCGTTVLAMALNAAGVASIPERNTVLSDRIWDVEPSVRMLATDPGNLNKYMISDPDAEDYTGDSSCACNYVSWLETTLDINAQLIVRSELGFPGGIQKNLEFRTPEPLSLNDALDNILTNGAPAIVMVDSLINPGHSHFVLVTAKLAGDYAVADPAGCKSFTLSKLPSGYTCIDGGPLTTKLSAYQQGAKKPQPQIVGYIIDPSGDASAIGASGSPGVTIMLTDPTGRRTGIDTNGQASYEIPQSNSLLSQLANEDPDNPSDTSQTQVQQVFAVHPTEGRYTLVVNGNSDAPFSVRLRLYSQDGTVQKPIVLQGTVPANGQSSYTIDVSTAPGSQSTASPTAAADTVAPTTTITAFPQANPAGWNNGAVTVALAAADNTGGSGVKSLAYTITGAQTASATVLGSNASIAISADGVTTITFFATDNAGNQEQPKTLTIRIDTVPPVMSSNSSPLPNVNGWNNTDVTVQFNAVDATSGVAFVTSPIAVHSEGRGIVIVGTATDLAGNTSTTSTTVNIDKTPPLITGLPNPGCTLWPPDHRLVSVANVAASDALSGVPSAALQLQVSSNETANAIGSGSTDADILINGANVQLRAERSGINASRIYTIIVTASDLAGNTTSALATCQVPHDQGGATSGGQ